MYFSPLIGLAHYTAKVIITFIYSHVGKIEKNVGRGKKVGKKIVRDIAPFVLLFVHSLYGH